MFEKVHVKMKRPLLNTLPFKETDLSAKAWSWCVWIHVMQVLWTKCLVSSSSKPRGQTNCPTLSLRPPDVPMSWHSQRMLCNKNKLTAAPEKLSWKDKWVTLDSVPMSDQECQENELCALESIYNKEEIKIIKEGGKSGGQFQAYVELSPNFRVVYRDLRGERK